MKCDSLHELSVAVETVQKQCQSSQVSEDLAENRSKGPRLEETIEEIRAQVELLSKLLQEKLSNSAEGGQARP